MWMKSLLNLSMLIACSTLWGGCQQMDRVFYRPTGMVRPASGDGASSTRAGVGTPAPVPRSQTFSDPRVRLAADKAPERPPSMRTPDTEDYVEVRQPGEGATTQPIPTGESDKQVVAGPATTQPAQRPRYTAPGLQIQQLTMLSAASMGVVGQPEILGAGRELSESLLTTQQGIIGRAGLSAPTTTASNVIISTPGIQRGPATGLGFASPNANIFRAQRNPASGPNGALRELERAGFGRLGRQGRSARR